MTKVQQREENKRRLEYENKWWRRAFNWFKEMCEKKWFLILALIFCWPIGIFGLFMARTISTGGKILLFIISCFLSSLVWGTLSSLGEILSAL